MKKKKVIRPKTSIFQNIFENLIIMRESDWLKLLRTKNKTGFQRKKKRNECNFLNLGLITKQFGSTNAVYQKCGSICILN